MSSNIVFNIAAVRLPLMCNFENDFCNLLQPTDDDFDWQRLNEATPTSHTGPTTGYNSEYFTYIEASPQREGDIAVYVFIHSN